MTDSLTVGSVFAGYRILGVVGRGGMGVVYRAEDVRLGRLVALKVLAPERAADQGFRERFIRESRTLASIDHPNIVDVFRADEADGLLFLAMRFIDGVDLGILVQRDGPLEPGRVVELLGQVAGALDEAHRAGLVHRDVKPSNVIVRPAGDAGGRERAYLSDFGLTKQISSQSGLTTVGQFLGTPAYVAPEQIQGLAVDGRADQYALGCVVVECLTGRAPYAEAGDAAVLMAHLMSPPPSVRSARTDLPIEVDRVIGRAMAKARDQRFATCSEFIAALAAVLPAAAETSPARTVAAGAPVAMDADPAATPLTEPQATVIDEQTAIAGGADATPPTPAPGSATIVVPPAPNAPPVPEIATPGLAPAERSSRRTLRSTPVYAGLAVILIAVVGGLAALLLSRGPGAGASPSPASSSARSPVVATLSPSLSSTLLPTTNPAGGFPTDADRRLLARIPPYLRVSCAASSLAPEERHGAVSVVDCAPAGALHDPLDPSLVRYMEFATPTGMDAAFDDQLAQAKQEDAMAEQPLRCTSVPYRGGYGAYDTPFTGRVMCYHDADGQAVLGWTVEALRIFATGWRDDSESMWLYDWWSDPNKSGPLG